MHISLDSALGRQRRLNSVGESVLQIAPDAAAAYSLRSLTGGDPDVVRVRRESDNTEKDFSCSQIESGEMARWVNEQPTLPLDLRELDEETGERDGALVQAAAAYSLRKLKEDFTGDVVEVRRNVDGETEGFTADEVTDGTLESFVKGEEVIYESDFSVGEDGWTRAYPRVVIEGNIDGIGGRDNCLKITSLEEASPWFGKQNIIRKGARYKVSYEFYTEGNFAINLVSNSYASSGVSNGNWISYEADFISDNNFLQFIRPHNDYPAYIRNVKIISYAENELPLDQATGAAAAYSLRNLSSSYTGDVVEVRRSSDDAVKSFTAAEVADGTLTDWVNVGNDYVGYARFQNVGTANVNLSSSFILEATNSWSIKFGYIGGTDVAGLFGNSAFSNGGFWFAGATSLGLTDDSDTYQALYFGSELALNVGQHYEIEFFNTPSEGVRVKVDGTTMSTSPNIYGDITIDRIGVSRGRNRERVIHNVRVDLNGDGTLDYSYAGDGNQASNWVDGVGSNNGTPTAQVLTYNNDYTDGHVRTWYDQSGSDNHAVQTTAAKQPKIVENGTYLGELDFDGTDDYLFKSSVSLSQPFTAFSVSAQDIAAASGGVWSISAETTQAEANSFYRGDNGFAINAGTTLTSAPTTTYTPSTEYLKCSVFDTTSSEIFVNGSSVASGDAGLVNPTGGIHIGRFVSGASTFAELTGSIKEIIIYDSNQSDKRRAIEENIANHYDISLAAFSRDGTVSTWYDQSGSTPSNDAVQTDAAKQPKIVDAGSLVTGGIRFEAGSGSDTLNLPAVISSINSASAFTVARTTNASATQSALALSRNAPEEARFYVPVAVSGNFYFGYGASATTINLGSSDTSEHLFTGIAGSSTAEGFIDGTSGGTVSSVDLYSQQSVGGIGSINGTIEWVGTIREIIIYNSDQSDNRTALEANIGETYGITDIPAANDTVNGYVQTWYDQSGSGNDAEQTTAANQPKIVGEVTSGQPHAFLGAIEFENGLYVEKTGLSLSGPFSTFSLSNANSQHSGALLKFGTGFSQQYRGDYSLLLQYGDLNFSSANVYTIGEQNVMSFIFDTTGLGYYNGTEVINDATTGATATQFRVGNSSFGLDGDVKEVIIYNSNQSANRPAIEANIANQYGITLS